MVSDWNAVENYLKQQASAAPAWSKVEDYLRSQAGINKATQQTLDTAVQKGYLAPNVLFDQTYRDYIEANKDNPVEAVARLNGAQFFSDREGIPFQQALANYDGISKAWYGNAATPITTLQAIGNGFNQALADSELNALWVKKGNKTATSEDLARLTELEDNLPPVDKYERWLPTQALVGVAQSAPYIATVMGGSLAGDLAVKGLATLAFPEGSLAIAGLQVFGKVLAAKRVVNVEKAVSVAAKAASQAGGMAAGYQGVAGLEFRDMVKAGINEDIAWPKAQWSSGLQSAVESLSVMDILPTAFAKSSLAAAAEKVIGEGILKGKFRAPLMKLALRTGERATLEGLEEASQQIITEMSFEIARQASNETGTSVDPKTWNQVATAIVENFKMGALVSLPLGALGEPFQVAHDAKTWKAYLADQKAKLDTKATADATLAAAEANPDPRLAKDPSGLVDPAHAYRDADSGRLYGELRTVGEGADGETKAVFKTGDPETRELYLHSPVTVTRDYVEIEGVFHDKPAPEDLGTAPAPNAQEGPAAASNAELVRSLDTAPADAAPAQGDVSPEGEAIPESMKELAKEHVKELMAQFPGKDLRWSPTDKVGMEIRDELIAANPRGEEYGLQWFDEKGNSGAIRSEETFRRQLHADRREIGLAEPGMVDAAVWVNRTLARSIGLAPDEYLAGAYADGVYRKGLGDKKEGDLAVAAQGARGATSFMQTLGGLTKSLMHFSPKADFSTHVHEQVHAYIAFLRANKGRSEAIDARLAEIEKAFEIADWSAVSTKWTDAFRKQGEAKGHNLTNEEVVAYAVEDYLRNQALPADPAASSVIRKIAAWIVDVYKAMGAKLRVQLTPEINEVLGRILADEGHPVHEAMREGKHRSVGSEAEAKPQPSTEPRAETKDPLLQPEIPTEADIAEAKRQYDAVPEVRDAEGRLLAPNGKPSNLEERQWKQVRTAKFKRGAGDWEAVQHRRFLDGDPVATLTGNEFQKDGTPLTEKVPQHYEKNGEAIISVRGIGEVLLDRRMVKTSLGHGMTKEKAAAFFAVPEVLREGRIISNEDLSGSRDRGRAYVIAAPVSHGGKKMVMVVLVKSDKNATRPYVHEVILNEELQQAALKTSADAAEAGAQTGAVAGAIRSILHRIWSVNPDSVTKVLDENGEPLVVYHGTQREFTVFDPSRGNDGQQAIFLTPNRAQAKRFALSAGFNEDAARVLQLFVNLKHPLVVSKKTHGKEYGYVGSYDANAFASIIENAKAAGHDGVIFKRVGDMGATSDQYVAFSSTQIKSATDNVGTFSDHPSIIYQPALESALTFDTWEEFRDYTEETWNWDDSEHAPEDLSAQEKDAWYRRVFEEARAAKETNGGLVEEAGLDAMAGFLEGLRKPGGLESFLFDIGNVERSALDYERVGAQDEADFVAMEKTMALRDEIRHVHPLVYNTARGIVRSGREYVTKPTRAAILSFMEHGLVDYAALAAEIRDDSTLRAAAGEALGTREKQFGRLKDPRAAKWEDLSIADRARLSDKFESQEIRRKISLGDISSDEMRQLYDSLEEELKAAGQSQAESEKLLNSQEYTLTRQERLYEKLREEEKGHQREIIRLNKEIAKAQERQAKLGSSLEIARNNADSAAIDLEHAGKEAKASQAWADDRLLLHKKWLETAIADKRRAESKLAAVQRELKAVKATDRVKQREAVKAAIEKAKAHIREVEARKKAARELRDAKFKAADRIMKEAKHSTVNWDQIKQIRAIQSMIDPRFRRPETWKIEWNGRSWTKDDFDAFADSNPEIARGALGLKWYERLQKKGLDELSLQELEELADKVEALAEEGRRILKARQEVERYDAAVIRNKGTQTLDASGKFQDPGVYGSKGWNEAVKKRTGLAVGKFDQMDDRHFAAVLDNLKDNGVFNRELIEKERDCRRKEAEIVERMANPIVDFMQKHQLDIAKIAQTFVSIDPQNVKIGEGKPVEISKETLMFARLALRDEDSRKALIGGNFFNPEFRDQIRREEEAGGQVSEATQRLLEHYALRIERGLKNAIDSKLTEDEKALADLMAETLDVSFDQFQEAFVVTFNHEMKKVKYYVPIRRQGSTYESLEGEVLEEFKTSRGMVTNPNKGMSEERIKIGWTHQKPIKTDLFGIYFDAVKKQAHLIAYADYIKQMNQAFKSNQAENFRYHLTLTHGREAVERLDKLISGAANPDQFKVYAGIDRTIRFMRGALGSGYLGFRPATALKQLLTSWEPFLPYTGAHLAGSAATALGQGPWNFVQAVEKKSAILRTRNMNEMAAMVKAGRQEGMQGKLQGLQDKSFKLIEWADRFCVSVGWDAAYRKGLAEGLGEEAAIRKADDIVLLTQPSGAQQDLAPFFREGGESMKILTQFMSPVSRIWQNWRYDVPAAFLNGRAGEGVGIVLSYMLTGAILYAVLGNHSPDDPDKETKAWILAAFSQMTDSVPLVGSYVSEMARVGITGKGGGILSSDPLPAISRAFQGATKVTKGAVEGSWDTIASGLLATAEGAGLMAGFPVSATKDVLRATQEGPGALIGIRKGGN